MQLIILTLMGLLLMSCAKTDTGFVIKDISMTERAYEPAPEQEAVADIENVPTIGQAETITFFSEEEKTVFDTHFIVKDLGTGVLIRSGDEQIRLDEGEEGTIAGIHIKISDIIRERKESYGIARFFYTFGKMTKQISMGEQESLEYTGDIRHTVTVAFIGEREGKDAVIFIVNGQRTKSLYEKEEFYFKDGSNIFVHEIIRQRTPRIIEETTITLEASR
ncbi:MAG: hypothetical protein ABIJ21_06270 [Nanoarchaeota archaeon]